MTQKELGNEIKHRLRQRQMTMKSWADSHQYKYRDVSDVVRGVRLGHYGVGRDIAQKLSVELGINITGQQAV